MTNDRSPLCLRYWLLLAAEAQGPFDPAEVRRRLSDRSAGPETPVCREGGKVWCPAGKLFVWFRARGRQKEGPYTFEELQRFGATGDLRPEDMLLQGGATKWRRVDSVAGLLPRGKLRRPAWTFVGAKEIACLVSGVLSCILGVILIVKGATAPQPTAAAGVPSLDVPVPALPQVDGVEKRFADGAALADQGRTDEAIVTLSEVIRQSPKHDKAYFLRGLMFDRKQDWDKAIADLSEVIRLVPDSVDAFLNRGNVFLAKREYKNADEDMTVVLRLSPQNHEAHFIRGLARCGAKRLREGIADYDEAIRLNPDEAQYYIYRAFALLTIGETMRAVTDADRAIKGAPNNAIAHYIRGICHMERGDIDEALSDLTVAIRLGLPPEYARDAFLKRAIIYEQRGDAKAAQHDRAKANELGRQPPG